MSWDVDLFGLARNRRRAAEAGLRASQYDRDDVRLALLAEIATNYVQYRLYQSQYAIATKSANSQAETVRITRVRFEQGAASRLDLERVLSQLAITRAAVPQALEQAQSARSLLVLLLAGTPQSLAADLPDTLSATVQMPVSDPVDVLLTPAGIIARRPDIRSAEQRLVAAAANLKAALAERYPQLTLAALFGSAGTSVNQLMTSASRSWEYGGSLTLPLFDFGRSVRRSTSRMRSSSRPTCCTNRRSEAPCRPPNPPSSCMRRGCWRPSTADRAGIRAHRGAPGAPPIRGRHPVAARSAGRGAHGL